MNASEPSPPTGRRRPTYTTVERRGPMLRPARESGPVLGMFGLDLTAGCAVGCAGCYLPLTPTYPGPDRLRFDPKTSENLARVLDGMDRPPGLVLLSPWSEPLPPIPAVRNETARVLDVLLGRGVPIALQTRGRIGRRVLEILARRPELARVLLGLACGSRPLSRQLEPLAAPPAVRLRGLQRLQDAGITVEVRLEPLIPELTDTRANLRPLFAAIAATGVRRVVAHYLFRHPSLATGLAAALAPLGLAERLEDRYAGGPQSVVGALGAVKHLPLEGRREGFARLHTWGAEAGLLVETGPIQNPDLHRGGPGYHRPPTPPFQPTRTDPATLGPARVKR